MWGLFFLFIQNAHDCQFCMEIEEFAYALNHEMKMLSVKLASHQTASQHIQVLGQFALRDGPSA